MQGCCPASVLVVNVEVDSMGGVVEGGIGLGNKTSPWRAAIEKVQAELRQEYDVREARKRELEYLEKGGDPLYFKIGKAASISVQSASFTDQHPDHFVTSEAKGSFGFTASPHGDSVESSGRPGASPREPNGAGNRLLFDAEHEFSEGGRNSSHPSKVNNVNSEHSSQMDARHNVRDENSTSFSLSRKAYKRRNRSRPIKDGTRLSSPDVNPTRGNNGSSLPSRQGHRDVKRLLPDAEIHNVPPNCNSQPASPLDDAFRKTELADGQQGIELDVKSVESTKDLTRCVSLNVASDAIASENLLDEQVNQHTVSAAAKTPIQMAKETCAMKEMPAVIGCQPSLSASKVQNHSSCCQMNGFRSKKGDAMTGGAHSSPGSKVLDSESSCTLTSLHVEGNKDSEMCTKVGNMDSNGNYKDQTLVPMRPNIGGGDFVEEKKENEVTESTTLVNEGSTCACQSQVENSFKTQPDEELIRSGSALNRKIKNHSIVEVIECIPTGSEPMRKTTDSLNDSPGSGNEISCNHRHQDHIDSKLSNLPDAGLLSMISNVPLEVETSRSDMNLKSEVDEDSILKEAEIIEAKRKRIMELSMVTSPANDHQKSHWDYVLEEMAWLANDFAQERIWKITAAAQTCHRVAFTCLLRSRGKGSSTDLNKVAHTLGKAVMDFWRSVEERSKEVEKENQKNGTHSIQAYAVRFLKYNSHAEMPLTPDRTSDWGVLDLAWEDNLTEDNLFYTIPLGAMETYRKSIESHMAQCERIRSSVEEEVETSAYDGAADFESQDVAYDGDEGEINMYDISSSRFGQKRKHLTDAYGPRMYEIGPDFLPSHCIENKVLTQHSLLLAKQPGINVSIPTKRVRTASRRVISPFNAAASGFTQQPNKTDASSGDTNSFQDDQSMLRCGSFIPNHFKVESVREFEKQLPFDSAEVSTKHKKKKKAKHLNVAYEQGDSSFQHEQRGHFKKRSEQLESNASSGLLDQSLIKKPKIIWQSQDNSFDNVTSIADSVPSPVASQISNMSNRNKFVKMLGRRDRGRKPKVLKVPTGQLGSGTSWSPFEEQALVVLVHDLGPNWELVSDAINSALHFKCVFHKAKECKERYNILTDRTSGDGVDSAEDSGSSQPYPSTLPGIPKGSARQLFQRLQGPMEEDTLKSHFEKIIMIGQKQHHRRTQDPKQLQQPHSSHAVALSQAYPNNLNGGPVLTPLELCDVIVASPDILSLGHQGSHSSGLAIPGRSTGTPIVPSSGPPSALQGSPNMMLGNNFPSSPGHLNSSIRDARFVVPRSASLSVEEQQRMQQYNHLMISNRNIPQSNISSAGTLPGADPVVRIIPGGNGMGMVGDINRIMPTSRPGIQGIASSSTVDSGSMVSLGLAPAMHSGVGSGQGSSMLRPMRPALSQDSPRQILVPDLQMPGSTQGVSHFGGLSPTFPNQTASPVSPYPIQHQSHGISPQQTQVVGPHHPHFQGATNQAYAIRLAKERQLQQRFQQQQQKQQFASSNSLVPPHVQSQPQPPISSPIQNSSQVLPQAASPSVSISPSPPAPTSNSMPQQKHPTPSQGVLRNAQSSVSGLANQTGKQRQKQQFSQANRQLPQQRQLPQAQQQVKVKGVGRGNMVKHLNIPIDPSVNGVSVNPVNKCLDKGEPVVQLVQNQGLYTGSTPHPAQPRLYVSPYSSNPSVTQQKMYSGQAPSSSKPSHNSTLQSDKSNEGHILPVTPIGLSAAQYSVPSLAMAGSNQQPQLHQKLSSQNQPALQKVVQPNCQVNPGPSNNLQVGDSDTHRHPNDSSAELDSVSAKP